MQPGWEGAVEGGAWLHVRGCVLIVEGRDENRRGCTEVTPDQLIWKVCLARDVLLRESGCCFAEVRREIGMPSRVP